MSAPADFGGQWYERTTTTAAVEATAHMPTAAAADAHRGAATKNLTRVGDDRGTSSFSATTTRHMLFPPSSAARPVADCQSRAGVRFESAPLSHSATAPKPSSVHPYGAQGSAAACSFRHFADSANNATTITTTPFGVGVQKSAAAVSRHPVYGVSQSHRANNKTTTAAASSTPCVALPTAAANSRGTLPLPYAQSPATAASSAARLNFTTSSSSFSTGTQQHQAATVPAAGFQTESAAGCHYVIPPVAVQRTATIPPGVAAAERLTTATPAAKAAPFLPITARGLEPTRRGDREVCKSAVVAVEAQRLLGRVPAPAAAVGGDASAVNQVYQRTALQSGQLEKEGAGEAALSRRPAAFIEAATSGDEDAVFRSISVAHREDTTPVPTPGERNIPKTARNSSRTSGSAAPHPLRRAWTAWQLLCFAAPPPGTSSLEKQYVNELLSLVKGYLCDAEAAAAKQGGAAAAVDFAGENKSLQQFRVVDREKQSPLLEDTSDEDSDEDDEEEVAALTVEKKDEEEVEEQEEHQREGGGVLSRKKSQAIRRKTYALFSGPDFARLLRLAQAEGGEFEADIQQWLGDYRARLNRAFEEILARMEEQLHPQEQQTETEEQQLHENLADLDAVDEAAVAEALDSLPDTEGFSEELRLSEEERFVDRRLQETDRVINLHEMLHSKLRQELQELDNHLADLKDKQGCSGMLDASKSSTEAAVPRALAATTAEADLSAGEKATYTRVEVS